MVRIRGTVVVIGIDTLQGCKEPSKQFALVEDHVRRIREVPMLQSSEIVFMVERNLGFEAEHHQRALEHIPFSRHRIDHQAKRFGILTTQDIKYQMMTLLNNMLRDHRINVRQPLLSADPDGNAKRLREQLGIYSFQYKDAQNVFGKQRVALCGKVGGLKDDVCMALQLGVYYSAQPHLYA